MDLDGRAESPHRSFTRLLLGLHAPAKPGGISRGPAENQCGPKSDTAAKEGGPLYFKEDEPVAFRLRSQGAGGSHANSSEGHAVDRQLKRDSSIQERQRIAGRDLAALPGCGGLRE